MATGFPPEPVLGPAKGRTRVRSPLRRAKEGRIRSCSKCRQGRHRREAEKRNPTKCLYSGASVLDCAQEWQPLQGRRGATPLVAGQEADERDNREKNVRKREFRK